MSVWLPRSRSSRWRMNGPGLRLGMCASKTRRRRPIRPGDAPVARPAPDAGTPAVRRRRIPYPPLETRPRPAGLRAQKARPQEGAPRLHEQVPFHVYGTPRSPKMKEPRRKHTARHVLKAEAGNRHTAPAKGRDRDVHRPRRGVRRQGCRPEA